MCCQAAKALALAALRSLMSVACSTVRLWADQAACACQHRRYADWSRINRAATSDTICRSLL